MTIPASNIEPAVGAATCPVGAQVCNGQIPASTAKPRNKNGTDGGDSCDQNKRETDPVEREMIIHTERRYPRHTHDCVEVRKIDIMLAKCRNTDREPGDGGDQRDPARKTARQNEQHNG